MNDRMVLNAETRKKTGSNYAQKIRKSGKVPAVFYTHGEEPIVVSLDEANLRDLLLHGTKLNDIVIDSQDARRFIFREVQYHPVTEKVLHVDLMGVRRSEIIQIDVPIVLVGEASGVKMGGVLDHLLHDVSISCKAGEIPECIEVDVTDLEMGDTITIGDIKTDRFEFGVTNDYAIASVSAPKSIEPEASEEGEEDSEDLESTETEAEDSENTES